jgi:peptide/nickel transport system substrate-binding protein
MRAGRPRHREFRDAQRERHRPFMLQSRQPDLETVLVPFDGWWGEATHGITEAVFTPIQNSATAVAALLSGEVDLINPVPVQDAERVDANDGTSVIRGIESRVIMLGFAHDHETLRNGSREPVRRRARAPCGGPCGQRARDPADDHAGLGRAGGAAGGGGDVGLFGCQRGAARLRPGRRARASGRGGLSGRFAFDLSCPNDRYLNDEAVCQAIVGMLAQVGMTATLDAMPVSNYWPELREDNFDMYLLGWSPGTFDAEHPIRFLVHTPGRAAGDVELRRLLQRADRRASAGDAVGDRPRGPPGRDG